MTRTKMTDAQKAEARRLYAETKDLPAMVSRANPKRWGLARLGKRYGVSRETIRRVLAEGEVATDE